MTLEVISEKDDDLGGKYAAGVIFVEKTGVIL